MDKPWKNYAKWNNPATQTQYCPIKGIWYSE